MSDKQLNSQKKKSNKKCGKKKYSVSEREGFEPSVRRNLVQRISNQPLSTTQPSLHFGFVFFSAILCWTVSKRTTAKLVCTTGAYQKKFFLREKTLLFLEKQNTLLFLPLLFLEKKKAFSLFFCFSFFWKKNFSLSKSWWPEGKIKQKRGKKNKKFKQKRSSKKKNHPGTKLIFPARLPTSLSTSSEFHNQVRDGLAWFHWSIEHQSISGALLRSLKLTCQHSSLCRHSSFFPFAIATKKTSVA